MAKPPVVAAPVHRGSGPLRVSVVDGVPLGSSQSWSPSGEELSDGAGSGQAGRTVEVDRAVVWPYVPLEADQQGAASDGEATPLAVGDQDYADPPVARESVELAGYLWPTPCDGATLAARAMPTSFGGVFH